MMNLAGRNMEFKSLAIFLAFGKCRRGVDSLRWFFYSLLAWPFLSHEAMIKACGYSV